MRIAQYYHKDKIRLGLIENNALRPLDFQGDMIDFIKGGIECEPSGDALTSDEVRWAPPLDRPSKIIGIGLNYMDHIREGGATVPEIPIVFTKFQTSLTGHRGCIAWDNSLTSRVDYEAELAVVIGDTMHDWPEDRAMDGVFGYCCANDVSARDLQFGDGQWVRGKSLDTFCPLGPWIVTSDEIPGPHSLKIKCLLNGEVMQDGNTGQMIFRLPRLISFLSRNFTLVPGDVILTGTPPGVGCFREPPIYLKNGDEVVVEIEGLGRLENTCRTS
jgi:2-keto-4-pentenoate hydratase/2-oxohepta-3-ene-1,7-dioic acid hydratase in catechol pathway